MSILSYLLRNRKPSASVAKERLQLIIAREHAVRDGPDYLPDLQRDLMAVVCKYVDVDLDAVKVNLDRDGDCEILELNISLPEEHAKVAAR